MAEIHIVHIVFSFSTGGLENGVVNIINKLDNKKYRHSIICLKDYEPAFFARIEHKNTSIYSLNKPMGKSLRYFIGLYKLLRQLRPNLVHTRNLTTLECQLVAWFAGIKHRIHGEHGWDSVAAQADKKSRFLRKLFSFWVKDYVALSKEGCAYLAGDIGVNSQRINHICNGVDSDKFTPKLCASTSEKLRILTVGRLARVKNQQLLLSAINELIKQTGNTDIELRIVGEGGCRKELEEYIAENNLQNSCKLLGDRSDIAELMKDCDIFVLPSFAEGISNTILEAMASGVAVIASNVGGNSELVNDGENGLLFSSNNVEELTRCLSYYQKNRKAIEEHGRQSRVAIEQKFSIANMIDKYDRLYQNIVSEQSK